MAVAADTTIAIPKGRWRVDADRSEVEFSVKHLLVARVSGRFTDFEGLLDVDPAGGTIASGSVRVASVDAGDAKRDESLRGPDFFDAERCPRISLHRGHAETLGGSRFRVTGDLEIRGIRHPVELLARVEEIADERAELTVEGHLSRSAYGIESGQLLDVGISDRVDVALKLSLLRSG